MKKEFKLAKLRLTKETLRNLSPAEMEMARGGVTTTSDLCTGSSNCSYFDCPTTTANCGGTGGSARC